jgi:hypothetical protein
MSGGYSSELLVGFERRKGCTEKDLTGWNFFGGGSDDEAVLPTYPRIYLT